MRHLKNNFSPAVILIGLLSIFPVALHSQTVAFKLRNGDRLTGKIIFETTNQVTISNSWAAAIVIPIVEIQAREIVSPTVLAATNAPLTNAVPLVKTAPVIPPAKSPEKSKAPTAWHGDVQVGADVGLSETTRQLYYGKFRIAYTPLPTGPIGGSRLIDRFRNIFEYNAAYGTTDGLLSANRMDGNSKTDFDLGKERRFFAYNVVGAGFDEIRKIDLRYEFGPGLGYHVLTRSNLVFNTEVGMNYQVQYLQNAARTERFFYRLAEDLTWKISKSLSFDEKFEFFPQVNLQDFRLRFESNLRYWLLENLSFNLTVVDLYDTQPAPTVGRNDLQIRSTIGIKF